MKGLALSACAVATGLVLWGSAAGAAPQGSAGPSARSVAVSTHPLAVDTVGKDRPRALAGVPARGSYAFLLALGTEPTGRAYEASLPQGRSAARAAAETQLATVHAAEQRVIAALPSGSHVLYQTHAVLAGVAVYTKVANVPALQRIADVAHVYPIAPKKPSLSYSVFLEHAPQVWAAYGDLGANSTVAIIDTGIDYTHADLGGPGTPAAYQTALANDTSTPTYPDPTKILGGYDFAGDAYDAGDPLHSTPVPDPNPLDCDGHGTHVAGIAAGYGENAADGSTFTGDYTTLPTDPTSYRALFRIGPGMAPEAKLYAYKVFGCTGSTDLIGAAIDRAEDPNNDGNTSDHVDVINMSLGSDYASPQDGDSVLANAASALGISVVAAAGNGGDLYDVAGSPGDAQRVIGAAASVDAYSQIDTLHVSAPTATAYGAQRSVAYDWATKPDLAGNVVKLTDSSNLDGCDPISQNLTGKIVFLEWTDNDATRRCGSAARSQNAENAHATGVILGEDEETFAAGIAGSADIPVVQVVKSAADAIRTALSASQTVTVTGTSANDFSQLISANDDKVASFSSRGIREAGDVKPDVSAVGASVFSAGMGTGNEGVSESGTSMATPEVAGLAALVRSQNSTWTPEEVKADIMNTAEQDLYTGDSHTGTRYAPNRVGAGRIDAKAALDNEVLAYVTNDPGAVSASFGPVAVTGPTTLTKTIALANKGATPETYDTSYEALTTVPGVSYSVSPAQVTVAAGSSTTVTLTLSIPNPAALTKTIDPTVSPDQAGFPREYVADASGRVLFTPTDASPVLRVPVYSAPRPASTMTQPSSLTLPSGNVETALLPLSGHGVAQGSGATAIQSIVAGFELQATSGALPGCGGSVTTGCIHASDEQAADLKYVGTTSDTPELASVGDTNLLGDGLEYFAITTQGPWHTAATQNEYDIYIDSTGDGVPDYVLFNTRLTDTDIFVAALFNLQTNTVDDVELINDRFGNTDTALFDSDTMVMPVWLGALSGVSAGHSRITYGVVTFGSFSSDPVDSVGVHVSGSSVSLDGTLTTDVLNPGLAVFGAFDGTGSPLLYVDAPGTLEVRRDAAAYTADHGQGALIVHFHNAVGSKAQVVSLSAVEHTLSVTKKGKGRGSVVSSPAGIKCSRTCSHGFADGALVTLRETPRAKKSVFAGWSGGGCSGKHRRCTVTMSLDRSVKAKFKRDTRRPKVTKLRVKVNHHKRLAKVVFRGTDPGRGPKGLHFKCKLDHHRFKGCRAPKKLYRHLRHGKHVVRVRVIDRAGNVSRTKTRRFKA